MTDLDKLLQMVSTDNISDELLAAYIDGNTTAEENEMIQSSMPLEDLDNIKDIAQDSLSFEEQLYFYDGDYGYWELGIPPILDINDNHLLSIDTPVSDENAMNMGEGIIAQQNMYIDDVETSGINANLDDINEFNNIDN